MMNTGVEIRNGGGCELCGKSTAVECFRNKKGNEFCGKCFKILHGDTLPENDADVSELF